jgi:hypothetical protein
MLFMITDMEVQFRNKIQFIMKPDIYMRYNTFGGIIYIQ